MLIILIAPLPGLKLHLSSRLRPIPAYSFCPAPGPPGHAHTPSALLESLLRSALLRPRPCHQAPPTTRVPLSLSVAPPAARALVSGSARGPIARARGGRWRSPAVAVALVRAPSARAGESRASVGMHLLARAGPTRDRRGRGRSESLAAKVLSYGAGLRAG